MNTAAAADVHIAVIIVISVHFIRSRELLYLAAMQKWNKIKSDAKYTRII